MCLLSRLHTNGIRISFLLLTMVSLAPHLEPTPLIPQFNQLPYNKQWCGVGAEVVWTQQCANPPTTRGHHHAAQRSPCVWAFQHLTWFPEPMDRALDLCIRNPIESLSEECLENKWALLGSGSITESSFRWYINGYVFPPNCCTGGRSQRDDGNEPAV